MISSYLSPKKKLKDLNINNKAYPTPTLKLQAML